MSGYRPKKRLGQHFLVSTSAIQRITDLVDAQPDMTIIEIGAGRGALTLPLAASGAGITAVEIDRDLIGYVNKLLGERPNVKIINEDFLKLDPSSFPARPFVLVGNLPYQITSPVVEWLVRHRADVRFACLMMQKEVADRLAASPGCKDWSPLSIFTQLYFNVERCFDLARDCFRPRPNVTSSLVMIRPRPIVQLKHPDRFERLVRTAFRQRRKLLVNNLAPALAADADRLRTILAELDLPDNVRAEQLSIEQFITLSERLAALGLI